MKLIFGFRNTEQQVTGETEKADWINLCSLCYLLFLLACRHAYWAVRILPCSRIQPRQPKPDPAPTNFPKIFPNRPFLSPAFRPDFQLGIGRLIAPPIGR